MELKFKPGDKVWAFYHLDGFIEHSEIDCVKITSEGIYYVLGTTRQCVPAEFLFPQGRKLRKPRTNFNWKR